MALARFTGLFEPSDLLNMLRTPGQFADGPNGLAGDDAGTGGGRAEQHLGSVVSAEDFVRDGGVTENHVHHLCAGIFAGLANAIGDLVGFPLPHANLAFFVAHNHHCTEAEPATALDHLGRTVDAKHFLGEAVIRLVVPAETAALATATLALAGASETTATATLTLAGASETAAAALALAGASETAAAALPLARAFCGGFRLGRFRLGRGLRCLGGGSVLVFGWVLLPRLSL